MRISDWSSDVCSSDLRRHGVPAACARRAADDRGSARRTPPPPARLDLPGKAVDLGRPAPADRPEQRGFGAGRPARGLAAVALARAPRRTAAGPALLPPPLHAAPVDPARPPPAATAPRHPPGTGLARVPPPTRNTT